MGRMPAFLNLEFALKVLGVYAMLAFGVPILAGLLYRVRRLDDIYDQIGIPSVVLGIGLAVLSLWFFAVVIFNWIRDIERVATFSVRTGSLIGGSAGFGMLVVIVIMSSITIGGLINSLFVKSEDLPSFVKVSVAAVAISFLSYLSMGVDRGVRVAVWERRIVEGSVRIIFSVGALLIALVFSIVGFE